MSASDAGGRRRIALQGDLIFETVPQVWHEHAATITGEGSEFTVDLQAVKRVDSSALALMVSFARSAHNNKKTLNFEHIPDAVLAIARVTGVDEFLGLNPS